MRERLLIRDKEQPRGIIRRLTDDEWAALAATVRPPGDETYARHQFRIGGYLTEDAPGNKCVWRVDGHSPYCGITSAEHDNILAQRRAGSWHWDRAVRPPGDEAGLRAAGHTPMPPDGGDLRITYRASEVIELGNRRYDEGWNAALAAEPHQEEPGLDVLDDGTDPWGDVWNALDRLVPAYPEDDDDMGEIRRIVSQRQDARAARLANPDTGS